MASINYADATGRLPYASEVFGTYRPMVGWVSRRKQARAVEAQLSGLTPLLTELARNYITGNIFKSEGRVETGAIGTPRPAINAQALMVDDSLIIPAAREWLTENLGGRVDPPDADEWAKLLGRESIEELYKRPGGVVDQWQKWSLAFQEQLTTEYQSEVDSDFYRRLFREVQDVLDRESRIAGLLGDLAERKAVGALNLLFFPEVVRQVPGWAQQFEALVNRSFDPFTQFDPTNAVTEVNVSPIGIVHYFRQYFFDLDTFLGPAVGHVWLTPGATVELVESSTRKTTVERTTETLRETVSQADSTVRGQDELSDAIRQENQEDSKLGFSMTVNQSWPSGDATATTSLNLDRTQTEARETTHKRMREQSQKISTELRSSYKTTFKTVTETTDVSSKRYVLTNPSETHLQNYEMRRKMRQVAVQVQDVGSYLCWETFVDNPGETLGLANLVHVAKPPDITPQPSPQEVPKPDRKDDVPFTINAMWEATETGGGFAGLGDTAQHRPPDCAEGVTLGYHDIVVNIPAGYRIELEPGDILALNCTGAGGEGSDGFKTFPYCARYKGGTGIDVILRAQHPGLAWDHDIQLTLTGVVSLVPTHDVLKDIEQTNRTIREDAERASKLAEYRASEAAYYEAVKDRIEQAAAITMRRFEDLREEERTVVYRALIADLMAKDAATGRRNYDDPSITGHQGGITDERRHVYATVLNAIFDIDKMLYFVAAEWWKPRRHSHQILGSPPKKVQALGKSRPETVSAKNVVGWSDSVPRPDNYYITSGSEPAKLGSSLGWLLQLDGDDMRNRFLNAPWVRAVIPIRPGKEEAALAWLARADVEGAAGLDATYAGDDAEVAEITAGLAAAGHVATSPPTIRDALRYLCLRVAAKHEEGKVERLFPDRDGVDDGDKVWSTPIEKVYEHGFYPLERSFRSSPTTAPTDGPSPNFQIMAQWTEVLPTDQVVPVEVAYDPITGRQVPPSPPT